MFESNRYAILAINDAALLSRCRDAIADIGEIGYVAHVHEYADAISVTRASPPTLAVIECCLNGATGFSMIKWLSARFPGAEVVALYGGGHESALKALQCGATAVVEKSAGHQTLSENLRAAMQSETNVEPRLAREIVRTLHSSQHTASPARTSLSTALTAREAEVLQLIARGLTFGEVGDALEISRHTVAFHCRHIYRKLSVRSRAEAVFEARTHGIVP